MIRALAKLAQPALPGKVPLQLVLHLPTQYAVDAPVEVRTVLPMIRALAKLVQPVLLGKAPHLFVLPLATQFAVDART
jgi:hypothetical protein